VRLSISGKSRALPNEVIREALRFYTRKLVSEKVDKALRINLRFTKKVARFRAEMWPRKKYTSFTIRCSPLTGPYQVLTDLAHEMIHIEQYLSGVMQETQKGTAWKGRVYKGDFAKLNEAYWTAPWEIDANGRQYWLYKQCRLWLKLEGYKLHK
jgi:hypothetical protein